MDFNDIDLQRSTPEVIELYKLALTLNFMDDVRHWAALLKSRNIDPRSL